MKLIWPFPTRDPLQYRRIDQGWDLQVPVGTPILAVADGVIRYGHDLHGFGDPYPILLLDQPLDGKSAVYLGHNHPDLPEGARVKQGDVIAHALQTPGGNASNLPGWLEIGFYPPGDMKAGLVMQAALIDAPVFKPAPTNPTEATLLGYLSAIDPDTDGIWFCDPSDGATFAFARDGSTNGARNLGALNTHPDWHAGVAGNPVVGFGNWKDDAGKNGYQIWTREPNNGPFHRYGFPADGSAR